VKSNPIYKDLE